jgi:4'-phosphopantetheinyl transferase
MQALIRNRRIPPRDVVVRFVRTKRFESPDVARPAERLLAANERASLVRLRAKARRDFLAAHALAHTMLAELGGSDSGRRMLGHFPGRRSEFVRSKGASDLRYSISHADGIAVCAVAAGRAVGVDVESLSRVDRDALHAAEVVCSPEEMVDLLAAPAFLRLERLLSIWALKEAVVKAMDEGFYLPLARLTIREQNGRPATVALDGEVIVDLLPCRLAVRRLTDQHVAAVALLGAPCDDAVLRFEEDEVRVPA